MYQLPSQFDPLPRHAPAGAAGGGSTSTTCSCCLVTMGVASIATAAHFGSLPPKSTTATQIDAQPEAPDAQATAADVATLSEAHTEAPGAAPETVPEPASAPGISSGGLAALGFFVFPIAAVCAGALLLGGSPEAGALIGAGVVISLFALAYEKARRSPRIGALAGIGALIAFIVVAAVEIKMWF